MQWKKIFISLSNDLAQLFIKLTGTLIMNLYNCVWF